MIRACGLRRAVAATHEGVSLMRGGLTAPAQWLNQDLRRVSDSAA